MNFTKLFIPWSFISVLGAADVLMQHNNLSRTGANLEEKNLTTTSVSPARFGRLWNLYADGQVVAQPLYVEGLTIQTPQVNGTFNAVVLATMHNTIYVYDADNEKPGPEGRTYRCGPNGWGEPRKGDKDIDMWSTNDPEWGILQHARDQVRTIDAVCRQSGMSPTPTACSTSYTPSTYTPAPIAKARCASA